MDLGDKVRIQKVRKHLKRVENTYFSSFYQKLINSISSLLMVNIVDSILALTCIVIGWSMFYVSVMLIFCDDSLMIFYKLMYFFDVRFIYIFM